MRAVRRVLVFAILAVLVPALSALCQQPPFQHDLLDRMVGTWDLEGKVMGRAAHHQVIAEWVLDHRFLRIHEKTAPSAPTEERRYEGIVFVGDDPVSDRYVAHWLDTFGGRFSETLGYGKRDGNAVKFVFEYPDGPFHTTFRWLPETNGWQWLMETKDKEGKWTQFADFRLTRPADKR